MRGPERILAITRKEFIHLLRDKRSLAVVLLLPIMELLLFAYTISFDVRDIPTAVIDGDRSATSRAYIESYTASGLFAVQGQADSIDDADRLFATNRVRAVVVIAPGFGQAIARGERAPVAVLVDGSEPNAARIGSTYAEALNQRWSREVLATWADRQGLDVSAVGMIDPRVRTWENPDRSSRVYLVPGLMVVIIMIVTVQQTAVSLVRERDLHTQEQMLVSPLRQVELMIGKLLPWTILAFLEMGVIAVLGITLFGVPFRGSLPLLTLASIIFVFSALGLGLIISAVTPSMETANVVALLASFFPGFLLSGFAFALDTIPAALRVLSYLFPARYMVTISHGVFLRSSGFAELWPDLLLLTAYALVVLVLAAVLYGRGARR